MKYSEPAPTFEQLVASISNVHGALITHASKAVNISLTLRNWLIGCYIAEYELRGADRATYGDNLLWDLAERLTGLKVSNCDRRQLYDYLKLYRISSDCADSVGTIPTTCAGACYQE